MGMPCWLSREQGLAPLRQWWPMHLSVVALDLSDSELKLAKCISQAVALKVLDKAGLLKPFGRKISRTL